MGAAYRGDNEMVQYLVSKGAKLDLRMVRGWSVTDMANGPALRTSVPLSHPDTIELLTKLGAPPLLKIEGEEILGVIKGKAPVLKHEEDAVKASDGSARREAAVEGYGETHEEGYGGFRQSRSDCLGAESPQRVRQILPSIRAVDTVFMEDMTWPRNRRNAIKSGKTTVILPAGRSQCHRAFCDSGQTSKHAARSDGHHCA